MPFLLGLVAGLVLVPVARYAGLAAGLVDRPDGVLRIHAEPVPLLGGAAVVASTLIASWASGAPASPWVVGAALAAMGVGFVDDVRPLPAWLRVAGQVIAGVLLAAGGASVVPAGLLAPAAVMLAAVLLTNAVNIVDGQDGLAGGLAAIAAVALVACGGWNLESPAGALGLSLAGALVAFLAWNRPPARIFLGNGGAYAVGILLLVPAADLVARRGWVGLAIAISCLAVFAFEVLFTVFRRVRAGNPVTVGDRGHSYDAMSVVLGSRGRTTLVFWGAGAASAGVGLALAIVLGTG